jgi:serine O-acetyltransferase
MSDMTCGVRVAFRPGYAELPGLLDLWATIRRDAAAAVAQDRLMSRPINDMLLRHDGFAEALACRLARKLADDELDAATLAALFGEVYEDEPAIVAAAADDLRAIRDRDPACADLLTPFLYFKGFLALQAYRISHHLWQRGRLHLARHMQSRCSEVFGADIHPAARLGRGILVDHGTGLVIGETAVVDDDVSMLQEVTLGGTGKETGDRHPKIRRGVLIGAGAKILGNIEVGEGAKVGAGSVVLASVPPYTTVVGVPARAVGPRNAVLPALTMDQMMPADRQG